MALPPLWVVARLINRYLPLRISLPLLLLAGLTIALALPLLVSGAEGQ